MTVKQSRSALQILSNNGLGYVSNQRQYKRNLQPFEDGEQVLDGTLTIINIKLY